MAGDCPHRHQLENTLRQCQKQTAIIAAGHVDYIAIISELKHELDCLLSQVAMVQQEFNEQDLEGTAFETSLKLLESQNDLLHQALEKATSVKDLAYAELEKNNEVLKCQIEMQQRTIHEKEQRIAQLNGMMTHMQLEANHRAIQNPPPKHLVDNEQELLEIRKKLEQANDKIETLRDDIKRHQDQECFLTSETRKLNDELIQSKHKNGDLTLNTKRLAALLKAQEEHRMQLSEKYESMEQTYECQSKNLRAANAQMSVLKEQFAKLEKRQDEHNIERSLLRAEVLSLKEKEAAFMGKHQSVQEQLLKTEKELYKAHDVIKEQRCILQRNDFAHKEMVRQLHDAMNDSKRNFHKIVDDYKRLETEYGKLSDVRKQNEKIIESFRKWKEAQVKADEATTASFKQYDAHIQLLLEDKQKFLEHYRNIHRDYCILQHELERLKLSILSHPTSSLNFDTSLSHRMELIRQTSRRISEQSSTLLAGGSNPQNCPGNTT